MAEAEPKLYTLTEVSKKTGISMPTLQRYKKLYQSRIPSKGKGRTQRYPEEALEVFEKLKVENVKRRGRPRKSASAAAAPKRARKTQTKAKAAPKKKAGKSKKAAPKKKAKAATGDLLTLTQISKETGISYPTLLRYVKMHLRKIPHKGSGRTRRYKPEAVEVFKKLRAESPRGRAASKGKKGTGSGRPAKGTGGSRGGDSAKIKQLERGQKKIMRELEKLQKALSKPLRFTLKR